ncbi:hypothetical protein Trydic_g6049 [Trypoxylus dichotomus]
MQENFSFAYSRELKINKPRYTVVETRELSEPRTVTRKLYNKCKKSGSRDEYKASLTRYKRVLRKAKRDSWKKFCQELEAVPECSRIRKVLAWEGPSRIGTLSKSDGTKAETEEQVLQHLLEVSGSEIIQTQFGGECKGLSPQIPDSRARRVDWNLVRKIIQVFKIRWAIECFKPFKSAGMDGIFRHCYNRDRICCPQFYGKTSYTEAKPYRPISLTSFLLKTLEKIIDKHLRDSALGRLPLHENQYAYQSGKSCEQAIHELARRAEIAFRHKEIALATFLDIEGAFHRASFLSMEQALQRRGVEPTLTRWITSILNNRTVHVPMNLCNIGATVAAGCSQGGVLSPLLWCLMLSLTDPS